MWIEKIPDHIEGNVKYRIMRDAFEVLMLTEEEFQDLKRAMEKMGKENRVPEQVQNSDTEE